jgi:hypothetical protein
MMVPRFGALRMNNIKYLTVPNTDNMGKLFVTLFAPPGRDFVSACWRILNFCSCTQDKFVMVVAPGHAHLHAIKILYLDKFLAPR